MNFDMTQRNGNYTDTLFPLLVESVIIGVLVNLVSDFVASRLQMDVFTVSLLLFVLLAVIVLYALLQRQWNGRDPLAPQKPSELGSILSLVFFARLLFLDCLDLAEFNRWLLIGIGAVPFFTGLGMTSVLDAKYHFERKLGRNTQRPLEQELAAAQRARQDAEDAANRARQEAESARRALQEVEAARRAESPSAKNAREYDEWERRINMRSVIQGDLDVERQPGVLLVIIESILSVKDTVTQMEIFEVCRSLSRKMPVANLLELIRDLMASFVNIRQSVRSVNLSTEDPKNWRIMENISYWKKNNQGM
jgi:hypothetical protein